MSLQWMINRLASVRLKWRLILWEALSSQQFEKQQQLFVCIFTSVHVYLHIQLTVKRRRGRPTFGPLLGSDTPGHVTRQLPLCGQVELIVGNATELNSISTDKCAIMFLTFHNLQTNRVRDDLGNLTEVLAAGGGDQKKAREYWTSICLATQRRYILLLYVPPPSFPPTE